MRPYLYADEGRRYTLRPSLTYCNCRYFVELDGSDFVSRWSQLQNIMIMIPTRLIMKDRLPLLYEYTNILTNARSKI